MVNVVVRVTHLSCFMAPFFLAQVQNLVHEVPEVAAVNASLNTDYDWTRRPTCPKPTKSASRSIAEPEGYLKPASNTDTGEALRSAGR